MLEKLMPDVRAIHEEAVNRIVDVKTQMFFCGGHGGSVRYDGKGGAMEKEGGPMDRIYVLRSEGELGGDHGLDIEYGSIDFRTGPLAKEVEVSQDEAGDTVRLFTFEENRDEEAVLIRGGIAQLGLPYDTVLVRGSVEASEMRWITGDTSGKPPSLPYTSYHYDGEIHPALLEWFRITESPTLRIGAWCKRAVQPGQENDGPYGPPFRTQQHLGSLRFFFDSPS